MATYRIKHDRKNREAVVRALIAIGYPHCNFEYDVDRVLEGGIENFPAIELYVNDGDNRGDRFGGAWDSGYKEITLDEVIVLGKTETAKVVLNEKYTALVTKSSISVGCQTFDIDVIDKLVEARDKVKGK